jgi:plastocyanin
MRHLIALISLTLVAAPAAAQEWRMAPEYDVLLTSHDIKPRIIRLKAGEPVRLRFVNNSNQALTFAADDFFRSVQFRRQDRDKVKGGTLTLGPLSDRTIALVPRAGRYGARSRNFIHRLLGMSGTIVVE